MVVGDSQPSRPDVVYPGVPRVPLDVDGRPSVVRVENFFRPDAAEALLRFLAQAVDYERVEYGDLTRLWRARRPLGEEYFGSLVTLDGQAADPLAAEALAVFESEWFLRWLARLTGIEVCFLRPPTPYRLDPGDRICLHDDMSDLTHAVSVALNLTPAWHTGDGGETRVGRVIGKHPAPTPADCPIELYRWEVAPDSKVLAPVFNSILVLRLGHEFAHAVEPVHGQESRYSVTTIYGHALV